MKGRQIENEAEDTQRHRQTNKRERERGGGGEHCETDRIETEDTQKH